MTVKTLFFSLFLYVALAWVGAALYFTGPEIVHYALVFTAIGLIAVLAFIILSRLFGWWRLRRAQAAARPPKPEPAAAPVHPDDQALLALMAEANVFLNKLPSLAGRRLKKPLSTFPMYLLVGPEGSGKTSTFLACGLEPQLVAGQGTVPVASTRIANFWLAKDAIFAEVSGRIFSGDLSRWTQMLRLLRGDRAFSSWRRLWSKPEPQVELRGVIAFTDCKEFTGAASDPLKLERSTRDWQERLRAISEVFGAEFPVYFSVSKCDKIPFFTDFFRRLPETEASQVLGCTLPVQDTAVASTVSAEAEAKRLTSSFRKLYHALAQRRLSHLAHEPNPAQRPGVYEFPRELKRIRSSVVQFLTEVFRPNPLGPGPLLRGYYLTGVRETEMTLKDPGATQVDYGTQTTFETSRIFGGDATQIFQPGGAAKPAPAFGRTVLRWMFVADLFQRVVLQDRLARQVRPTADPMEGYRRLAFGGVCALCLVLCGLFTWSWSNNRELLTGVQAAVNAQSYGASNGPASATDLQALDKLRRQIYLLQGHLPWSYHWGLYSGDRVLRLTRAAYFRRFQRLLLNDINGALVSDLRSLPANPDANAPDGPVYRGLKTHLTITSGVCTVDQPLVSQVLKEYRGKIAPGATPEWKGLADQQIDFYTAELASGNPVKLQEDVEARDKAREYLRKVKGLDSIYNGILAAVEKQAPKVSRLPDLAPGYRQVLSGPEEVRAVFSKDGWTAFERASKELNLAGLGEPCVTGSASGGVVNSVQQSLETTRGVQRMYAADYIDRWQKFVKSFSVLKYNGPEDAARKLGILSDHGSPLLAVFALTANQTSFPAPAPTAVDTALQKKFGKVTEIFKKAETERAAKDAEPPFNAPAEITRSFQPVHSVVPPGSETWVVDKNQAYIDALSQLRVSMQAIADAGKNADPAVHQLAGQNYDKALETVRTIARTFKPVGVGGLDNAVENLLAQPIRLANGYIIRDIGKDKTEQINRDLHSFCVTERGVFRRYPFNSASSEDASLDDLSGMLQPATGALWKFQQQSLADLVVKEGGQWKVKDASKKPTPTSNMIAFLNQAQRAVDALYPGGAAQPQFTYTLRPKLDASFKDTILELEIDGKVHQWTTGLQKQFSWPAPPGTKDAAAIARLRTNVVGAPFASRGGMWAIFRIFGDAEPRDPGSKIVEWKYMSGGVGRRELIQPAAVQLEIVNFPGGVDVFNPKFWAGLQCPQLAVQ